MLLWNFCTRLRTDPCSSEDKAEFALDAWAETQAIQDSLDIHVCNLDTALIYMCREYIYKYANSALIGVLSVDHSCLDDSSRMTITQSLRRLVPSADKYVL